MDRRGNREKEFSPLAKFTELHSWWTTFAAWINGTFKMVRSLHGLRETTKTNSLPPSLRHQRLLLMTFPGKTTRDFSFLFFFFRTAFNAERHEVVFEFEGGKGGGRGYHDSWRLQNTRVYRESNDAWIKLYRGIGEMIVKFSKRNCTRPIEERNEIFKSTISSKVLCYAEEMNELEICQLPTNTTF